MDFEITDNLVVNHREINGVKIVEIYRKTSVTKLDFVLMSFSYNEQINKDISALIEEYRKKEAGFIIGCIGNAGDVIDCTNNTAYEAFRKLTKKFDMHLDTATESDFENLVKSFTVIETSNFHIMPDDINSKQGTEIHIITEESASITELKNKISTICSKLLNNREKKFPKLMLVFYTNEEDLTLDEVQDIMHTMEKYCDLCGVTTNDECTEPKTDLTKFSLIFWEEC